MHDNTHTSPLLFHMHPVSAAFLEEGGGNAQVPQGCVVFRGPVGEAAGSDKDRAAVPVREGQEALREDEGGRARRTGVCP